MARPGSTSTTKTAKIFIRNLDHIRTSPEPVKSHYVAEAFDDVSLAYGQLKTQIDAIASQPAVAGPQGPAGAAGQTVFVGGSSSGGGSGSAGVASLNALVGALSLVPGANITITPSGTNITIAVTGITVPTFVDAEIVTFSGTSFTLAHTPIAGSLILVKVASGTNPFTFTLIGGGVNYTLSGASGTLVSAALSGEYGVAWYRY